MSKVTNITPSKVNFIHLGIEIVSSLVLVVYFTSKYNKLANDLKNINKIVEMQSQKLIEQDHIIKQLVDNVNKLTNNKITSPIEYEEKIPTGDIIEQKQVEYHTESSNNEDVQKNKEDEEKELDDAIKSELEELHKTELENKNVEEEPLNV